ncbi:hypothetical protein WJX72_008936 [[Myrmecia] bisecta]|uniref:Uncharacterized protein n=1 Tax=[Myrmecia] bisecta TaxID=41462 RepID=A0AAW1QRZ3_9CHLO
MLAFQLLGQAAGYFCVDWSDVWAHVTKAEAYEECIKRWHGMSLLEQDCPFRADVKRALATYRVPCRPARRIK